MTGRIARWWHQLPRLAQRLLWIVFGWVWLISLLAMIEASSRAPEDMLIRGLFLLVLVSPLIALELSRRGRP